MLGVERDIMTKKTPIGLKKQEYHENGFIFPIRVLSLKETLNIRQSFETWEKLYLEKTSQDQLQGNIRFKPHLFLPSLCRIVHHPVLVSIVREILDTPNILLWSSDLNIKEPFTDGYYALHQDGTYTGLDPLNQCLTVWLALSDPVDELHGCMKFRRSSHVRGLLPHHIPTTTTTTNHYNNNNNYNMLSKKQYIIEDTQEVVDPDKHDILVHLRGGEASIHHSCLVHQSGPNHGPHRRIGFALRYIASTVRQTGCFRESVTLVQGSVMTHDGFDLEPILSMDSDTDPDENDILRGFLVHQDAMQREAANYFSEVGREHVEKRQY